MRYDTPTYSPPETTLGLPHSHSGDMWSLGGCLRADKRACMPARHWTVVSQWSQRAECIRPPPSCCMCEAIDAAGPHGAIMTRGPLEGCLPRHTLCAWRWATCAAGCVLYELATGDRLLHTLPADRYVRKHGLAG